MNILLYLISKNYRRNIQEEYTRNLTSIIDENYNSLENIYKEALLAANSKAA